MTLIEQRRDRFERLEDEFEHQVQRGDATELFVLERAGITRPPDIVLALTGDDEDNMVICQLAQEKYGVPKVIARVNDPRNQAHFDLLGISPTICATSSIMALVEHEVPEHDLIHLLELRKENLEIVEVQIDRDSPSAGKRVEALSAARGRAADLGHARRPAEIAVGSTTLEAGDQVLAILEPGKEDELRRVLLESLALLLVAGRRLRRLLVARATRAGSPVRQQTVRELQPRLDALRLATRAARATTRTRPGSPPRTSARSLASRSSCRARSTRRRSTSTASRSAARRTTCSSSRRRTA